MGEYVHVVHGFEPVFDSESRLLILGSLPSVKPREEGFYYGNPRNRFWQVTAMVTKQSLPNDREQKIKLLKNAKIALWDVVAECDIIGSGDASIKNVISTDLSLILSECKIEKIYANGSAAARLYRRFQLEQTGIEITALPSTSPANAAWSLERLCKAWQKIAW